MNEFAILAMATAQLPTRLDPVRLFLHADIVVMAVMAGLLLASIWTWMIIVSFIWRMRRTRRKCARWEKDFLTKTDGPAAADLKRGGGNPSARVAAAAMDEWRQSVTKHGFDREGTRQRLGLAMESQVAEEADTMAERLTFLASVGSVAPFVGLFGTVWGIMSSFFQIGVQQNSSLAVVAPGISEALFATAIGLFAAIPAVIAYNRFSHDVNRMQASLQRFADRLHARLSRDLERL